MKNKDNSKQSQVDIKNVLSVISSIDSALQSAKEAKDEVIYFKQTIAEAKLQKASQNTQAQKAPPPRTSQELNTLKQKVSAQKSNQSKSTFAKNYIKRNSGNGASIKVL